MSFIDLPSDFPGYLPIMDVEALHVDPRRREDRDCAPSVLWHIDDTGTAHVLCFEIELDRMAGLRVATAMVVNCSANGLCIVSRAFARIDEAVCIKALDAASGDLIFRETYVVRGKRRTDSIAAIILGPTQATGDDRSARILGCSDSGNPGIEPDAIRDVHRYALRLDHNGSGQVFKSFLDSLFLENLRDQTEVDLVPLLKQMAGRERKIHKAARDDGSHVLQTILR